MNFSPLANNLPITGLVTAWGTSCKRTWLGAPHKLFIEVAWVVTEMISNVRKVSRKFFGNLQMMLDTVMIVAETLLI